MGISHVHSDFQGCDGHGKDLDNPSTLCVLDCGVEIITPTYSAGVSSEMIGGRASQDCSNSHLLSALVRVSWGVVHLMPRSSLVGLYGPLILNLENLRCLRGQPNFDMGS